MPDALPQERDEAPAAGFSVADLCRRWKVGPDKVHGWLRRGELVGVNVATSLLGRPQWRVTPESVERFERRRSSAPAPKAPRRRRQAAEIDFYPD
jgi:Helix-turn-helix domain